MMLASKQPRCKEEAGTATPKGNPSGKTSVALSILAVLMRPRWLRPLIGIFNSSAAGKRNCPTKLKQIQYDNYTDPAPL